MKRKVITEYGEVEYELIRKRVKNINIRITPKGEVKASAPHFVPLGSVDALVVKCGFKIAKIKEKASSAPIAEITAEERERLLKTVTELARELFPLFPEVKTPFPTVKVRKMTSRWGSCNVRTNTLTFSTELAAKPFDLVYYVVAHELCHLVVGDHSKKFWERLERVVPNCKAARKRLNSK